ncbi:MAG: AAA family ATPase [Methanobrevibacter sp.]|jgi:cobyric acid synthase|nr:AAA family ATPase [Candidatus Methanoflexus mossambicus]
MKIGMAYIKGALPGFETFGNLPTDLVKPNGFVNGVEASKELDGLIIPGGSIIESQSLSDDLAIQIKKMAADGKFILGICSGFQVLANKTDVGRNSPSPIVHNGLGLLDLEFSPFISTDRVEAIVNNDSFITNGVDKVFGFHCHTYGKIENNNEKEIIYSPIKRANYSNVDFNQLSGVINDDGNIVGTMIHGMLDNNPKIIENVFNFLDANENDINDIYNKNKSFKIAINNQLGIDTNINIEKDNKFINNFKNHFNLNNIYDNDKNNKNDIPPTLFIGSQSSDSGKTFITTGIAAALKKRGLKVAILKIGSDIRDTLPGIYMTNELMEDFASIKIGNLGWLEIDNVLNALKDFNNNDYDVVLIEGAMSVLIGILKDIIPYSGAEIALSSNIPLLLVSNVSKGGIESSAIDLANHIKFLKKIGLKVNGAILNRVYDFDLVDKVKTYIKKETNIDIQAIGKATLAERGGTPEVEINLEDFALTALNTIEKYLDLEKIVQMAEIPHFDGYLSMQEINNLFK